MGKKFLKTLSATFLIAGTCVGGGIIGLPLEAGSMGFYPALLAIFLCWIFMTSTGLLYAQASLWVHEKNAHVVSIAKHLLGRFGEYVAIVMYLFMAYASLIAYNAGGGQLVLAFFENVFHLTLHNWQTTVIYAAVFGLIFYLRPLILGYINALFVVVMIVFYFLMMATGIGDIKSTFLTRSNFGDFLWIIPLMVTSFSMQMIVPSISLYVNRDPKALRTAILGGTTIAAVAYILWMMLVLGLIPYGGEFGLHNISENGITVTHSLRHYTKSSFLGIFCEIFAFFAIATSYFGIGLGLYDFLSDLTKVDKRGWGRLLLGLMVVVPTVYFTILFPNIFLFALDITGGLGDSILNGILPVLMVWIGHKILGYSERSFPLISQKPILSLLMVSSIVIFLIQCVKFFV